MKIIGLVTGPVQENCYLIWKKIFLLIVDPGAEAVDR